MAKSKTKRNEQIQRAIQFELYGILILTLSVVAMAGLGAVGRSLTYVCRMLIGNWNFLIPSATAVLGVYVMVKRRWPSEWTPRWTGTVLFMVAFLVFNHMSMFDQLREHGKEGPILLTTWQAILDERNSRLPTDIGGGMVGALFYALFHYLFDDSGTPLASVAMAAAGLLLMTGFSFVQLLRLGKSRWLQQWARWKQGLNNVWRRGKTEIANKKAKRAEPEAVMRESEEIPVIHDFTEKAHETTVADTDGPETEADTPPKDQTTTSTRKKADKNESIVVQLQTDAGISPESYQLPAYSLLGKPKKTGKARERQDMTANAKKLEATLESFGVKAKVMQIHRGPSVTRYEVQPDIGVKVSRIVNLADDLALALAAKDIRIEAPIPGKSAIGIEVPNREVAIVSLREVLESAQYHESTSKLSIALGRDISGEPIVGDLAKMPHLLVAGATGSGKSVCINGMITSLLYKAKPNEVKMMMIDPKMVELNVYNGIPHLLAPVVTDPRKAAIALKKVVAEMENRYELFAKSGARDIERFNQMVMDKKLGDTAPLPYIVVIVDELADLMMVAPADVEDAICRLAQMARAAGIHLILATQRPSVDVITGVIKANIPSRIAFGVSSQADSRTILDMGGAEKLLGRGDMLYLPMGANKPIRVQGALVTDREVEAVVQFVKEQQQARYLEAMIPKDHEVTEQEEVDDELYPQAVQVVVEAKTASVSLLQRRLRIGYTRAARLIDMMESHGIVGPYEGSKPREVRMTPEQWKAQNRSG
ncbi:DNA translocase FtsK [Polycladomyces sp. WAk]|uniref:DNA translocase FtsK n=1 Tax=Polycladomyces zharkentensis TaxID=2807616 RepID=A0ABS2WIK9_9BACL|nr:DNA translocase FtsK [Polycladomyces sp. WAk]MBN2909392.1 DNA translocase FtsK [Polycladomyces sp. WAk]